MNRTEIKNMINELTDALKKFTEMYEKESNVWKPENGETYWFVRSTGSVDTDRWYNNSVDVYRHDIGNCYRTEAEAVYYRDRRLTETALRRFALENNGEFGYDRCFLYFDCSIETMSIYQCQWACIGWKTSDISFSSRGIAINAIESIGEENLKKLFLSYDEWLALSKR